MKFEGAVHKHCCVVSASQSAAAEWQQRGPDEPAANATATASRDSPDDTQVHRHAAHPHLGRVVARNLSNEPAGQAPHQHGQAYQCEHSTAAAAATTTTTAVEGQPVDGQSGHVRHAADHDEQFKRSESEFGSCQLQQLAQQADFVTAQLSRANHFFQHSIDFIK